MNNIAGAVMGIMIGITAVGTIVLVVIAVVQEGKMSGRGGAVRSAFTYIVSLVMLGIIVVSSLFLIQEGARAWVFKKAQPNTYAYQSAPPMPGLFQEKTGIGQLYDCKDTCQLTDADKAAITQWKTEYATWKEQNADGALTTNEKRDIVTALSFLIVALPLYWWFFVRTSRREAKRFREEHGKTSMLQTVYFYIFSLTGLVATVVAGALLINTALKSVFNLQTTTSNNSMVAPSISGYPSFDLNSINSVINCTEKCGLSADDVTLAKEWKTDYATWQKKTANPAPTDSTQTDLANYLPLLLVMAPLFVYHFFTIRRETSSDAPKAPANPTAGV